MPASSSSRPRDSKVHLALADETQRLRVHAHMRALAFEYCVQMTSAPIRWPLRKILNQEFRYVLCCQIIANFERWCRLGREQPTLSAVKRAAQVHGTASARHIADFVASLRHLGLLSVTPESRDRRMLLLEPSAELIEEIGRHPRLVVEISDRLAIDLEHKPAIRDRKWTMQLVSRQAEISYWATIDDGERGHLRYKPFPAVAAFAAHESGYLILLTVLRTYYATLLLRQQLDCRLTLPALSADFHVSRSQVANVLHAAEASGWFKIGRGGHLLAFSPALVDEFEHFIALQAAYFGLIARDIESAEAGVEANLKLLSVA